MPCRLRALALPFLGAVLSCLIVTAAPAPAAERVTVKRANGTTVAGELMWSYHDGVGIRPSPKADPVLVPWKDVASVSNGLTRRAAIAKWKQRHADNLCGDCQGDRSTKHEPCEGTGVAPETKKPCATCKGTGAGPGSVRTPSARRARPSARGRA